MCMRPAPCMCASTCFGATPSRSAEGPASRRKRGADPRLSPSEKTMPAPSLRPDEQTWLTTDARTSARTRPTPVRPSERLSGRDRSAWRGCRRWLRFRRTGGLVGRRMRFMARLGGGGGRRVEERALAVGSGALARVRCALPALHFPPRAPLSIAVAGGCAVHDVQRGGRSREDVLARSSKGGQQEAARWLAPVDGTTSTWSTLRGSSMHWDALRRADGGGDGVVK